jgi:hypothetical protein
MTLDKSILSYVKLRDRKKELEARHTEELQPINTMLERLEAHMLEALNEAGLQSAKSPHGTAYKSTRTYAKVIDFAQVLAFIREHDAWDLLEHRVSKKAAETIIEETQEPIPGVETSSEVVINVRRAAPAC